MSGFLYYAPSATPITSDRARELGLAYAFESGVAARFGYAGVSRGPDGASGYVFADSERVPSQKRKYVAEQQEWRKIPGLESVWVGLWKNDRPGPNDLRRPDALRGHTVKLADENEWLVPVARGTINGDGEQLQYYKALPQISTLDDDGRWRTGAILPRYAPLWDVAQRFATAISLAGVAGDNDGRYVLEFDNLHTAACLALQTNYRLGPAEIDMLGLLTEGLAVKVLQALIDFPTLLHWMKKKRAAAPGDSASDPVNPAGDGSSSNGGGAV